MDLQGKVFALQAIGSSIQTLLGPNKGLKCYISSTPDESAILSDAILVLEVLCDSANDGHPIGQLLYDCCQEQQKSCGCGVTSLVCLCSYWASEILSLTNMDIPLPIVFVMFEELLTHCNTVFSTSSIPLEKFKHNSHQTRTKPSVNQAPSTSTSSTSTVSRFRPSSKLSSHRAARVLSLSRHFSGAAAQSDKHHSNETQRLKLGEKMEKTDTDKVLEAVSYGLSHGKELAMQLAVKTVQLQQVTYKHIQLDDNLIFHHCLVGRDQSESEVVNGLIVSVESDMAAVLRQTEGKELRILVINGDCTPAWKHMGLQRVHHVTSHDPQQLYESSNKTVWLKKCAQVLENLRITLVVVGGIISPLLWEHCLATGIMVLTKLSGRQLDGICRLSNATPTAYITHCSERHIGSVELEMKESGMDYQRSRATECFSCRIKSLSSHPGPLLTVILHGRTRTNIDTLRYQFNSCLQRLKHILNEAHLLPGAGRTEARCIYSIQHLMNQWKMKPSSPNTSWPSLPTAFSQGCWMSDDGLLHEWRAAVCDAFMNGLKRYMVQIELNCRPGVGYFVAMTTVESRIQSCNDEGDEMMSSLPWKQCVFDVDQSKRESWKRAVQLLRMVFLSANLNKDVSIQT